jgi:hypothetical protein
VSAVEVLDSKVGRDVELELIECNVSADLERKLLVSASFKNLLRPGSSLLSLELVLDLKLLLELSDSHCSECLESESLEVEFDNEVSCGPRFCSISAFNPSEVGAADSKLPCSL